MRIQNSSTSKILLSLTVVTIFGYCDQSNDPFAAAQARYTSLLRVRYRFRLRPPGRQLSSREVVASMLQITVHQVSAAAEEARSHGGFIPLEVTPRLRDGYMLEDKELIKEAIDTKCQEMLRTAQSISTLKILLSIGQQGYHCSREIVRTYMRELGYHVGKGERLNVSVNNPCNVVYRYLSVFSSGKSFINSFQIRVSSATFRQLTRQAPSYDRNFFGRKLLSNAP